MDNELSWVDKPLAERVVDSVETQGDVARVFHRIASAKQFLKEVEAKFKRKAAEVVERDGPFNCGPDRFYIGTTSKTECTDKQAALDLLLTLNQGDLEAVCKSFSSQPFRHGDIKRRLEGTELEDQFDKVFQKVTKDEVTTGKPVVGLKIINTDFL